MKRTLCILIALLGITLSLSAQRVEVGLSAPRIGGVEWISDTPELKESVRLLIFFHSSNEECRTGIANCNALAYEFRNDVNIVVITKEPAEQVASLLMHEYQFFYAATDEDGSLFEAFNVRHVPYAVIINREGEVAWMGNPLYLKKKTIQQIIDL